MHGNLQFLKTSNTDRKKMYDGISGAGRASRPAWCRQGNQAGMVPVGHPEACCSSLVAMERHHGWSIGMGYCKNTGQSGWPMFYG